MGGSTRENVEIAQHSCNVLHNGTVMAGVFVLRAAGGEQVAGGWHLDVAGLPGCGLPVAIACYQAPGGWCCTGEGGSPQRRPGTR